MSVLERIVHVIESTDETELWMLPYSTLMLILILLFVVFYGFSLQNSVEYEAAIADLGAENRSAPGGRTASEVAFAKDMREYIKKSGLSGEAKVEMTATYIRLNLKSPALFESGQAELKPGIKSFFEEISNHLRGMHNLVIVEGHTDNVPIRGGLFRSNWELSAARAFSVINFFISRGAVPERLVAHGFGEFRPAFPNDTEGGRAKNRRIEITIVRESRR
jgi:chemotaxis protein MotB